MTAQTPQASPVNETLVHSIRSLIEGGVEASAHAAFDTLALELFAWQFTHNAPYRAFCQARRVSPDRVSHWTDIPAYPTEAFKNEIVTSFPNDQAVMAQLTSGTTANRRGMIFRDEIGRQLVFSANRIMTGAWLFPDFAAGQRCRILILAPSPQMAPSMGMAIGMEQTRVHFGTPDSRFLLSHSGLDVKALVEALAEAESTGIPVALIGSTSAFVYFFNACRAKDWRFNLPAGSRIADGGGYRGRFGEVSQQDYWNMAQERLGIPASHCVNVLGMAETATNYFDNSLRYALKGQDHSERLRQPPPWARTQAVSLDDGKTPLPDGEIGLLRHIDLANVPTVMAVQTDNLGYMRPDGSFQIVGRAKIENGKVSTLPSERVVGPMGDKAIFRFLESYVNFSIRFKMGFFKRGRQPVNRDRKQDLPLTPPSCPCDQLTEEILAEQAAPSQTQAKAPVISPLARPPEAP